MNTGIRGVQDSGKTALMVGKIRDLLMNGLKWSDGYRPDDVIVNFPLYIEGVHVFNNKELREYIGKMVHDGIEHKIIGIDEADRVFPARFWSNKEQSEALIGLWQDVKLNHQIFWVAHEGTGVDLILRETAQVLLMPEYNRTRDCIEYFIINGLYKRVYYKEYHHASRDIFPYYDRWKVIR